MVRRADVVIGANYGDEGKGLFTDYLAEPYGCDALVVRFNGGAQAGHTVTLADGRRHIFSHFGSGTLAGAATYLSRYFVCNPLLYGGEYRILQAINITPHIYIDPDAIVTTPYDMMINQIVEEARGENRHGSCGVGFGETIERSEKSPFLLTVKDLPNTIKTLALLKRIRTEWIPQRLAQLGLFELSADWRRRIASDDIMDAFLSAARHMMQTVEIVSQNILCPARHIIFEGAQGLLLDQDRGAFPHVTRSYTGLRNCVELATVSGIDLLDITYATRSYLTRHGAGPLARELPYAPYLNIEDETNRPNPYQGCLRFAWLDLDQLRRAIHTDLQDKGDLQINYGLGMSCLDQLDPLATYIANGMLRNTDIDEFINRTFERIGVTKGLLSFGPTRQTIEKQTTIRNFSHTFAAG